MRGRMGAWEHSESTSFLRAGRVGAPNCGPPQNIMGLRRTSEQAPVAKSLF
jgi:hypothetical protein